MLAGALQLDLGSDDAGANLAAVEAGLAEAARRGARLVVLPEMWPTSFPAGPGPAHGIGLEAALAATDAALARVGALSAELGLVVCGSAYHRDAPGERPANRLHVLDRGRLALVHDKVHLFSPTAEGESFRAGALPPPVAGTSAGRIAGVVCYDLRFPELARCAFAGGAEILVCPAQWPAPRAGHFRALVLGRAVESQCFVIAANRTGSARVGRHGLALTFPGNSLVASPDGVALSEGQGAAGLVLAELALAEVAEARRTVPVAADRRPALYRAWGAERAEREE